MTDEDEDEATSDAHPAAYASNWKTVLLVDGLVGFAVFVAGVLVLALWNLYVGAFIGSCGLVYMLLVVRRARQWAGMRRDAGLNG